MKIKIKYLLTIFFVLVATLLQAQGNRRFPIGSVMQTAYDANAKASTISLLNNNLSYQSSGSGNGFVRSTTSHTVGAGGIYAYEVTIQANGSTLNEPAGIVASTVSNYAQEPASVAQVGGVNVSYSYYGGSGAIYTSNAVILQPTVAAFGNFDVIGIVLNTNTGTLTFYKNGVTVGTPITGITGTWYAMSGFASGLTSGQGQTNAVFMASEMTYGSSYPSGFQGW